MTSPAIDLGVAERVATITIRRPERRNALNLEAVVALDEALATVADDVEAGAVRCLVLTGHGGHFCAGADLTELEDLTFTDQLRRTLDRLVDLPVPTVAAVAGSCMGLGMQLAIACDVRVADADARFAVPVARLGLMVDHWTLHRLTMAMGWGTARHLVLTAAVLTADDGFRLGFVQERGDLRTAHELAGRVAVLAPLTLAGSKLGLNALEARAPSPEFEAAFRRAWESRDLVEGRQAFAERRDPGFLGR